MSEANRIRGRLGLKLPDVSEKPTQHRRGAQVISARRTLPVGQAARFSTTKHHRWRKRRTTPLIKAKGEELLSALKLDFPELFGVPPKPLKLGIGKQIRKHYGASHRVAEYALGKVTRPVTYIAAVAKVGSHRYGLDGEAVGPVSEEDRRHALSTLLKIKRQKIRSDKSNGQPRKAGLERI